MALVPIRSKNSYSKPKEFNILLLGETGVGKSTTLNAIANYLKYATIEEARESMNKFVEVIPSQFTLQDPTTPTKEWVIKSGISDQNEKHEFGESVTQGPVGYRFEFDGYVVRIIDTPGIGDTGGSDEDSKHFDNILAFLQHHEKLSAILFLVKGTDARKTPFFKYCITELIRNLHPDVSRIMMFCFTHSRDSNFGPGNGYKTLQSFFEKELTQVKIKLEPLVNCFFIDNEAYRYLLAKRVNYPFRQIQELGFKDSWECSTQQVELMFENIIQREPHLLYKTICLNMVRKIITEFAQPMIQMQKNIEANIACIQKQKQEMLTTIEAKGDLERFLQVEYYVLELKPLPYPTTVCTNSGCIELFTEDGEEKINYKTRCHKNCTCWFVSANMTGQTFLMLCEAMEGILTITCRGCKCSWRDHMHIDSEYESVKRTMTDPNVQAKIHNTDDLVKQIELTIERAKQFEDECKQEIETIKDVTAKFAFILKENSFFTHSKFFEDYIDFLIKEEKKKKNPKVEPLERMKRDHKENQRILDEKVKNQTAGKVLIEDVPKLRDQLLNLKHSGPSFQQILETVKKLQEEQFSYRDKPVLDSSMINKASSLFKTFKKFVFG